ncbi:MAG TPA: hypothetical protein DHV28_14900 [Ignavibacteriales bacterium]|nr:hypothetical protein [Ignavibacteriales bacterium]
MLIFAYVIKFLRLGNSKILRQTGSMRIVIRDFTYPTGCQLATKAPNHKLKQNILFIPLCNKYKTGLLPGSDLWQPSKE